MSDFKKLRVWRKSHALALNVHRVAIRVRGRDSISLRSQMLRAAMSIPANIVEGTAKGSDREMARFLQIALGSSTELEYHLLIARDSGILPKSDFDSLSTQTIDVKKMLHVLIRYLKTAESTTPRESGSS